MQIAPEAVATFLQRQKNDAETYAKNLAYTMAELNGLSEAEAQCLVTTEGERAIRSLSHQLASWRAFMRGDANLVADCETEAASSDRSRLTNETDRREKFLNKLAAMGGRPALGAMVLPGMAVACRASLQPTASPAAREILHNRASAEATPPWQARARAPGDLAAAAPDGVVAGTPAAQGAAPTADPQASPATPAAQQPAKRGAAEEAGEAGGEGEAGAGAEGTPASAPVNTPLAAPRPDATATPANTPASAGPWMKELRERKARGAGGTPAGGPPQPPQGVAPSELQAALQRRAGGGA